MEYIEYNDAQSFLKITQHVFEENEALFGLMLGISLRLVKEPFHYGSKPYLATISDKNKLQLIALMTPPHKLQIASFNNDPKDALAILASYLKKGNLNVPAVLAEEKVALIFETEWQKMSGDQSEHGMRQRIYKLCSVTHQEYSGGSIRQATIEDLNLLASWYTSFYDDCFGNAISEESIKATRFKIESGDLYVWENSTAVSMAGFTRSTRNGVSVCFVYTPPEFRQKGYASTLVASLSRLALKNGKQFCTLYTDLSNPTSNSIYQKIGYNAIADVMDINFMKEGVFNEKS